ncbi:MULTISPECIES: DUF4214 domain-containing protein [Methylobacterium]|uniref:DUF4214 domain-containing protein n=1 Tax=Methylobacterium TaxID=407 RepID=UPI0010472C70|nr:MULTISPECIES: DUF4214 domain-containing protein [Methylobacterium]MDR7040423.1 hypothetical protein [Methylobacterium sp. BE186]
MAYDPSLFLQSFVQSATQEEQERLLLLAPYTLAPDGSGPVADERPVVPAVANATDTVIATLSPSNNSGVSGQAIVQIDETAGTVTLDVVASGLTPNEIHPQHIHGFDNDSPSLLPNITLDIDLDGFVEDPEGADVVGPVILSGTASGNVTNQELSDDFPVADAAGNLRFHQEYRFDLSDPTEAAIFQNLQDRIAGREFQIHGLTVQEGQGACTDYEVDGTGGYIPVLPVANGIFLPVVDTVTAEVARLYVGVLDRAPDTGGLEYWSSSLGNGASLTSVAAAFLGSAEYGALHPTPLTDTQFVENLYADALGRAPDAGGQQYWVGVLGSGTPRADVAVGIAESPEAQQSFPIGVEQGWQIV